MERVGGLAGSNGSTIAASYATGPVSGEDDVGGLVGSNRVDSWGTATSSGTVTAGYSDRTTSGSPTSGAGQVQSTLQLQTPTGYTGIYAQWNRDLDGDGSADNPWRFATDAQYPALAVDFDGDGQATWEEFGHQVRAGPAVTASSPAGGPPVALTWTAVDTSPWTPAPPLTYAVYRAGGRHGRAAGIGPGRAGLQRRHGAGGRGAHVSGGGGGVGR